MILFQSGTFAGLALKQSTLISNKNWSFADWTKRLADKLDMLIFDPKCFKYLVLSSIKLTPPNRTFEDECVCLLLGFAFLVDLSCHFLIVVTCEYIHIIQK